MKSIKAIYYSQSYFCLHSRICNTRGTLFVTPHLGFSNGDFQVHIADINPLEKAITLQAEKISIVQYMVTARRQQCLVLDLSSATDISPWFRISWPIPPSSSPHHVIPAALDA